MAQTGRNAQGVRLIRLGNEELLVGVVSVEAVEEDEFVEAIEGEVVSTEQVENIETQEVDTTDTDEKSTDE